MKYTGLLRKGCKIKFLQTTPGTKFILLVGPNNITWTVLLSMLYLLLCNFVYFHGSFLSWLILPYKCDIIYKNTFI